MCESNILTWLDELRFCTESYEPLARPLSGGTDLALLFRTNSMGQTRNPRESDKKSSGVDVMGVYEKIWECSGEKVTDSVNISKNNDDTTDCQSDKNKQAEVKHADVCRVSVVFQNCDEVEDVAKPVKVENIELYLTKDILTWITELWYSSEEEDNEEFEEFEKYQQERVENRPPTPKFPVVPEVQLRKSNSLKPNRGTSRSNTIHIVQQPDQPQQKDICISNPLKLTWKNSGVTETIDKGVVVYRDGLLKIQYDSNQKVEMKMSSTMKNNKIWEFSNSEECVKVSVDKQSQITMGSPRQRRKSVEEDSPKNLNKQNILMKLLRRRSDKQLLEKKGIFKNEDIFGNKLTVLYESSKSDIPEFVKRAVELIETEKNIKSEHIYRLSGNMATIQKIRLKIDGKNYKVLDEYKNDVDVLTGCLKLFYRELVEPLIPYKTFEELNKLTPKPAGPDRDKLVKSSVKSMKTPHKENLLYLIQHLLTVESYKQYNKMTIQSLSIVWGPSMLWYPGGEKCTSYSPYEFSMLVNGVLELILTTFQADLETNLHSIAKYDSRSERWKELDTVSEETVRKSPSGTSSRWLFALRKSDSKDKLTGSTWSLSDTKKDKPSEGYFGKSLESLPKSETYPNVPKIIVQMTELIEKDLRINGLYIKANNKDALGKFKKKIQKNKFDLGKMDALDAAMILLKFLQDLEPPLLPKMIYEDFVENFDNTDNRQEIKDDIGSLSQERQDTINHLASHILKVLDYQENKNRENILHAWLPVFSSTSKITVHSLKFVEIILDIYDLKRYPVRELPLSNLPLKTEFEHRFNFKKPEGFFKNMHAKKMDIFLDENANKSNLERIADRNNSDILEYFYPDSAKYYRQSTSADDTRKSLEIFEQNLITETEIIENEKKDFDNKIDTNRGDAINFMGDTFRKDVDKLEVNLKKDIDKVRPTSKYFNFSSKRKDIGKVEKSFSVIRKDDQVPSDVQSDIVDDIYGTIQSIDRVGPNVKTDAATVENTKKDETTGRKIVNRGGLFIKHNSGESTSKGRSILASNLNRMLSGQTLENAKARAQQSVLKKT